MPVQYCMSQGKMLDRDRRSSLVRKNIAGSILIKGWGCIVQLLLVPATLKSLNQYEYGVWLTISSILLWLDQFDIGLGNGLRNKLAEAVAKNDFMLARRLVSTAFVMLTVIIVPIVLVLLFLVCYTDVSSFLSIDDPSVQDGIIKVLIVSILLVGATFIFKLVGNVYLGLQLPAVNNLLVVLGQTLALVVIFVLSCSRDLSLIEVACICTASPLIVYLLAYPITFRIYGFLRPSFCLFDKCALKDLFSLGVKFFIVQVAGLIIFATSNILISKILSPSEVTPYQISYKYFSFTIMLFTLISAPVWSATTDAYSKDDWSWINRTMHKMDKVMFVFVSLLLFMLLLSEPVYDIWVGDEIKIDFMLSVFMSLYMAVLIFSTCYSNVLFGIGKIRVIAIATMTEAVVYIPLAVALGHRFGLYGIVGALLIVNLLCAVCNKIQFNKLASGTATGIWNK